KVHLRTGSESGAEIERLRQNAYHGDRLSIHIYFLADDGGVGIELPLPKRIGKQGDGMGAGAAVVRAKQVAQKGLHSKNLKEIADHHQAGGGLRDGEAGEAGIVRRAEREISGYGLPGAALIAEFFVGVGGIGGGGKAIAGRWRNPGELIRIRKRKRPQKQRIDDAEDRDV